MSVKALSWTPVRNGAIYCAPACGRGCTAQQHEEAVKQAANLARRLPGFEPDVWENLGWHYQAVCGSVKVRESFGGFFAYGGGRAESGDTPVAAVKALADRLGEDADEAVVMAASVKAVLHD